MKLVRIVAVLATLAVAAPAAHAQGGGQGRGGPGRQMEMLMQGITLTDAQKTKIDSIQTAFRTQMPAFTPGQPMDSTARAKRMEVMGKQNSAIRDVLTADQQKVFDKNVEEMRNRQRPNPQH